MYSINDKIKSKNTSKDHDMNWITNSSVFFPEAALLAIHGERINKL